MFIERRQGSKYAQAAKAARVVEDDLRRIGCPHGVHMRIGDRRPECEHFHMPGHAQLHAKTSRIASSVLCDDGNLLAKPAHLGDATSDEKIGILKRHRPDLASSALSGEPAGGIARSDKHIASAKLASGDHAANQPAFKAATNGFDFRKFGHARG